MTEITRPITPDNARRVIAGRSAHALLSLIANAQPPLTAEEARAIGAADEARTAEKLEKRNAA